MRAGLEVVDLDPAHDEDRGLAGRRFSEPRRVDAEQPDEVGAGALEEFEEVGVIDDAGAIGVLEIDAHREDMGLALDAAGNVGPPPGQCAGSMGARTVRLRVLLDR